MRPAIVLLGLIACGKDKETTPDTDGTTPTGETGTTETGDTALPPGPDLVVLAENDYALTTSWTFATRTVRSQENALVSWAAVAMDAEGQPLTPSQVPLLALFEIAIPPAEIPARFAADDLGTGLVSTWQEDVFGKTYTHLDELAYQATPFSSAALMLETNNKAWLAALVFPDGDRLDVRQAVLVTPEDNDPSTQIALDDASSSFTWTAALTGAPLTTAQGYELYTVDWSDLGNDAYGKAYDEDRGDVLFIGRFDEAPSELGGAAKDLSTLAEAWWTMDVVGDDSARLDLARDAGGASFSGFSAGSTWVVGVECSTCLQPFPLWATVVEVE
jgi:hypothetical protein